MPLINMTLINEVGDLLVLIILTGGRVMAAFAIAFQEAFPAFIIIGVLFFVLSLLTLLTDSGRDFAKNLIGMFSKGFK